MNQPTLFELDYGPAKPPVAKARRTDPDTSKQAADEIESSGAASIDRAKITAYVHQHPTGLTAPEIAIGLGWVNGTRPDNVRVSRRIKELIDLRELRYGETREGTRFTEIWPEVIQ